VSWMLGGGVMVGLALTWAVRKYISSVVPLHLDKDAGRILGLTAALVAAGWIAALLPGRRASSIEPVEALREE
jgi:ABC-type lipoprotein release transport system permease subunit